MSRYRLRFLLQEFDLPKGETVIGRSLDCNLTIEDPLVSRQHARIVIDEEGAAVEDMGSRNGVRVNGVPIKARTPLKDGDRVRLGTQDFVFCRVDPEGKPFPKTTGVLRLCANCRLPYPREVATCPNCEHSEQIEEETLSGSFGVENQNAWSVQLLVEALERALALGRIADAERIAKRATAQIDELVGSGSAVDAKALAAVAAQATAATLASNDPTWGIWVFDVYTRVDRIPPVGLVERLGEVAAAHPRLVRTALEKFLQHLATTARSASRNDIEALARLEQLRRLLEDVPRSEADVTGDYPRPS